MQVKVIVFIGLFIFTGAAEGRQLAGNSLLVKVTITNYYNAQKCR